MIGWAVVAAGEVWEVCDTRTEADRVACWLVETGHLAAVTIQPYDEDGPYLPDDHGC